MAPLLGQELECHIAVESGVAGLVDETHTAAAEPFDDLVVGNRATDHVAPFASRPGPGGKPSEAPNCAGGSDSTPDRISDPRVSSFPGCAAVIVHNPRFKR